jgi:glycosyltransferase 2 family protein
MVPGRRGMRLIPAAAAVVGSALIAALVVHFGADAVIRALRAVGWPGFAAIIMIHLALIAVLGIAWWVLLPGTRPAAAIWGRLVRDSASEVLPISQLGGYVAGARALAGAGVAGTAAAATTIVDVTLELLAQLAYTALALALLLDFAPADRSAAAVAAGLAVAVLLAAGFIAVQRRGFGLVDRIARAVGPGWTERMAQGAAALHAAIATVYRRRGRLAAGFLLHFLAWIANASEAWLVLRLAGRPLGFGPVLAIEGLLYAVRSVAFAVPNAVGVQEGAYIVLGAGFGVTPETALALSLLKRGRDLTIGLPALLAWQLAEGRHLWRRSRGAPPPAAAGTLGLAAKPALR